MERKGQYTGWVEEVLMLGYPKLGNRKKRIHQSYRSLGLIVDPR